MTPVSIACIVEGYGDVEAVPILVRRIVHAINPDVQLYVPQPPIRVSRDKIKKSGELEKAVALAALKNRFPGSILILLDAEEDCPATLAPVLRDRAVKARSDVPISVVLAKQEYEAWFLAAIESLQGQQELALTMTPPLEPEGVKGAKEWLRKQMPNNRKYSETIDQPALTRHFDLERARNASSFDKCWREIAWLLSEMEKLPSAPES